MPLDIRDATLDDWPMLESLERAAFGESASVKWLQEEFQRSQSRFRLAIYKDPLGYHPTQVVGYCLSWVVVDEIHLLNIAVRPTFQRRGFASRLVEDLKSIATEEKAVNILLEVRESNLPAQALYQKHHFVQNGRRPRYYRKPVEDAFLFAWFTEEKKP